MRLSLRTFRRLGHLVLAGSRDVVGPRVSGVLDVRLVGRHHLAADLDQGDAAGSEPGGTNRLGAAALESTDIKKSGICCLCKIIICLRPPDFQVPK